MATKNLARVYNPARKITAGRVVKRNPVKKTARVNPARRKVAPARRRVRRQNPASTMGLIGAALVAGVGITLFDLVTTRFVPASPTIRIGVKAGGAWAFQSFGGRVPVLGKYKNEIALVLAVGAVVDLLKLWVVPAIDGMTGNLLTGAPAIAALPAAPAGDELGEDVEYYYLSEAGDEDDEDEEDDF